MAFSAVASFTYLWQRVQAASVGATSCAHWLSAPGVQARAPTIAAS
jgi:hypothetical protein